MKKTWKRNLIAAGVLLVVCAGIYLNWYAGHSAADLTETLDAGKILDDTTLVLQQEQGDALVTPVQQTGTQAEYFAQMRRQALDHGQHGGHIGNVVDKGGDQHRGPDDDRVNEEHVVPADLGQQVRRSVDNAHILHAADDQKQSPSLSSSSSSYFLSFHPIPNC